MAKNTKPNKGVTRVDDGVEIDLDAFRADNPQSGSDVDDMDLDAIFDSAYEDGNISQEGDQSDEEELEDNELTESEDEEDDSSELEDETSQSTKVTRQQEQQTDDEEDEEELEEPKKKSSRAQQRIIELNKAKKDLQEKLRAAEEGRMVAEIEAKQSSFFANKRAAESEKASLENKLSLAMKQLVDAQTQADSEAVAKATDAVSEARTKLTVIEASLERFKFDEEHLKVELEKKRTNHQKTSSGQVDAATAEKLAAKFLRNHPKMYVDPSYRQMVDSISQSLRTEGETAPDTQEFWSELEDRVQEVLAVKDEVKTQSSKTKTAAKPKQPVSSQGSSKSGSTKNNAQANTNKVHLNQEELKMAKFFGMSPIEYAEYKNLDDGSVFLPKKY